MLPRWWSLGAGAQKIRADCRRNQGQFIRGELPAEESGKGEKQCDHPNTSAEKKKKGHGICEKIGDSKRNNKILPRLNLKGKRQSLWKGGGKVTKKRRARDTLVSHENALCVWKNG